MMGGDLSAWFRRNLFNSPADAVLSVVVIPPTAYLLYGLAHWTLVTARWSVVTDNLRVLLMGTIPAESAWRAWVAAAVVLLVSGMTLGAFDADRRVGRPAVVAGLAALAALVGAAAGRPDVAGAAACVAAGFAGRCATGRWPRLGRGVGLTWLVGLGIACAILAPAGAEHWGGLLLSVLVTAISTLLSIPLGILVALGRRSTVKSVRVACTAYVELIRSVPLLSIVYWAWIIVPLVLPPDYFVPDLVRGIAGFTIFYAALVAEYVRAGLQGVSDGQREAAEALGLGGLDVNTRIMLPQAIRTIVPALVGNVLDVFNNVPLVFIIGLTDFLKAGQTVLANPQYGGLQYEVYGFLFAVYLVVGALVSHTARRLELSLQVGSR